MKKLEVTIEDKGKRLDLYLSLYLQEYSRSSVRKLLDQGKVKLRDELEYRPNYKVQVGDVFNINTDTDLQRRRLLPKKMELNIVYRDEDIVVVDKPIGLKVHPTGKDDLDSLLNGLYYQIGDELGPYGVNLVNRIDKSTSGLVVASISAKGAWHYSKQFAEAKVNKEYLAVVPVRWQERYGEAQTKVGNFLNYDWQQRLQTVDKQSGDYALTFFQLQQFSAEKGYALINAIPKTGRTHQIRIHLSYQHLPIVGDNKYGGEYHERLMLHAHKLGLISPSGEEIRIEATPDPSFFELTS